MYVCPDCKTPLEALRCPQCRIDFPSIDGIPVLLSNRAEFKQASTIADVYESLYQGSSDVWDAMGRSRGEFLDYFRPLLSRLSSGRILEIGCGEGGILAAIDAAEKVAVDLSPAAIKVARTKADGEFSVALAEALPFPTERFDLVVSLGVMEHFLDERRAFREIRRVLRPGGYFVSLIHVRLTLWDRIALKVPVYLYPRPRPIEFARWLRTKLAPREEVQVNGYIYQPIQRMYTTNSGKSCFERHGFKVVDMHHTRRDPSLPLRDLHVVVYVGRKELD
jgi:SAM-dependent methyltransferase